MGAKNIDSLRSVPEFFTSGKEFFVVVPKIQRAYAQGRANEENLRTQFVEELFSAIENERILELSFVYGAKTYNEKEDVYRFELLDGQQRITTLILLYWYIASAEGKEVPEFIQYFSYETRTTSTNFLERLSKNTINTSKGKPSDIIRDRQWYTRSFDKDSSVHGMLNMLDEIHRRYCGSPERGRLYERLDYLKFYELDLDDFGLTEEIYVKMNARGLQLTPFENFKADLVKFMKRDDMTQFQNHVTMDIVGNPSVPYYLNFSHKLDNSWLNLFWRKEDKTGRDYCTRYFRFFYRYFASKVFLEYQKDMRAQDYRPKTEENKIWDFFWRLSPKQQNIYLGFKFYNSLLKSRPEYIHVIEQTLDWFSRPETQQLLDDVLCVPWDKDDKFEFFGDRYRLSDAVMFTAICEYIERSEKSFDEANFRRWIHIVHNAIADQLFRNVNEMVSLLRNLVLILNEPNATADIFNAIANVDLKENVARSIQESSRKAQIILDDPSQDWEKAFYAAEEHPLFAGSIGFLLKDMPQNVAAFTHRFEVVGAMFDKDGMTERSKENHRLIRSMARQLRTRTELLSNPLTTLTEQQDKENHLRSLLLEKDSIGTFLCFLGDKKDLNVAYEYIDDIVDKVPDMEKECPSLFEEEDNRLLRAYRRICMDSKLYDFIQHIENHKNRSVVFMQRNEDYTVDYRNSWYDRIYIGTDRLCVIQKALFMGYEFYDSDQNSFYEKYGDVKDNEVWMTKEVIPKHTLELAIYHDGTVYYCFEKEDKKLSKLFENKREHPDYENETYIIDEIGVEDKKSLGRFTRKLNFIERQLLDNIK
jgi:hypothetical protein